MHVIDAEMRRHSHGYQHKSRPASRSWPLCLWARCRPSFSVTGTVSLWRRESTERTETILPGHCSSLIVCVLVRPPILVGLTDLILMPVLLLPVYVLFIGICCRLPSTVSNAVVTCEIKLFQNYSSLRRRPSEIILPEIISK